jgi:hypothetical protein
MVMGLLEYQSSITFVECTTRESFSRVRLYIVDVCCARRVCNAARGAMEKHLPKWEQRSLSLIKKSESKVIKVSAGRLCVILLDKHHQLTSSSVSKCV